MMQQTVTQKIFHFFLTKIIIGIAVIAGFVFLVEAVGRPLLNGSSLSENSKNGIIALLSSAVALTSYIFIYRVYEKRKITELRSSAFLKEAMAGLITGFALQAIFIFVIYIGGAYSVVQVNPVSSVLPALSFALTAGFVAEILIVGVFFRLVEQQLGTIITLVIISVLFALFHFNAPAASALSITATAIEAGLLIAAIYVYTRSLWTVIFFHFAWDFAEPGIFGGINPGNQVNETLLTSKISGSLMLTGGQTGPQNSLPALLICLLLSMFLLLFAHRKNNWIDPYWKKYKNSPAEKI